MIQHILDELGPEVAKDIIDVIISTMISLSMQKFSSNVVEKCFDLVDMVKIKIKLIYSQLVKEWSKNSSMLVK